jgi:hypothetical protein
VHQLATSARPERRRYRWCPACRELWVAARFPLSCPLCSGHTFAYVGRSPYDAPYRAHPQAALKGGADVIETTFVNSVSIGLDHLRDRLPC